ncbi:hypothetical protein I5U73_05090 [Stenotrophomonas maltophilia]|nr:hypothetical protein [Stenotrophomonas maltophilia]
MTVLTLMGAFGAVAIISGLPMFLFVMYAKLAQQPNKRRGSEGPPFGGPFFIFRVPLPLD